MAVSLMANAGSSCAQESSIAPYFGASVSADIINLFVGGDVGWSLEAGMRVRSFYAGLEYGISSPLDLRSQNWDPVPGSGVAAPRPVPNAQEEFWGLHAGYIFDNRFYVGVVVLRSQQPWQRVDSTSRWLTFTKDFLNLGPDLRYSGIDDGHIYLALAYTVRRGLKAGVGYLF
ncbi:MAG: hypothetical protein ACREBW_00885 [Candidatus Micrarchaeaceae archaeon]